MTLFDFGKKKEVTKTSTCSCNGGCTPTGETAQTNNCCNEVDGICCIKVLGSGCKTCHEQYENVEKAVNTLGIDIEIEYITDMEKVMTYGVMSMPAIVINEKVVSMGKLLKPADVEKLLLKHKI